MIAIIPCKGISKRIPKKNLRLLNGKPLVQYTIDVAKEFELFSDIILSSESDEALTIASNSGISPFFRSETLSGDRTRYWEVCEEVLLSHNITDEPFAVLLPTSPFRTIEDLRKCYNLYFNNETDCVMSVSEVDHLPHHMLIVQNNELIPLNPDGINKRRQDVKPYYRHDGLVIVCNTSAFLKNREFYGLTTIPYSSPKERSLDIDNMLQWKVAETILNESSR